MLPCPHCNALLMVSRAHGDGVVAKCAPCGRRVIVRRHPDRLEKEQPCTSET